MKGLQEQHFTLIIINKNNRHLRDQVKAAATCPKDYVAQAEFG